MGLGIGIGGSTKSGGGGASSADKQLANVGTLYGSVHNLFKVAEELRKDSVYGQYVGIMLFALDKGYSSISLKGASAYVTSDGSYYTAAATHKWHDGNDGYLDRWVAYLFASSTQNFNLSSDVLPKKIVLDGQINNLSFQNYATQISEIVCTDGSSFGDIYISNTSNQQWNKFVCIGKIREHKTSLLFNMNGAKYVSYDIEKISVHSTISDSGNTCIGIAFPSLKSATNIIYSQYGGWTALRTLFVDELQSIGNIFSNVNTAGAPTASNIITISAKKLVEITSSKICNTIGVGYANLVHLEIGDGFRSEFNLSNASFANCLLTDANDLVEDVVAHPTWSNLDQWLWNFEHLIVDKLADLSGQTAKTITLAAAPYAAITESIRQKMSAKNWNLASA